MLIMWKLTHATLWATTLVIFPGHLNAYLAPKTAFWLMGSWLIASAVWWNSPYPTATRNPFLGILAAWIILLLGWHLLRPQLMLPFSTEAIVRMPWKLSPIIPTFIVLGSLFAIDSMVRHASNPQSFTQTANVICYIGLAVSIYGIMQLINFDPLSNFMYNPDQETTAPVSFMGNEMLTANLLAITAPLCLAFRGLFHKLCYITFISVIILANSAASLVAAIIGSLAVLWMTGRRLLSLLLVAACSLAIFLSYNAGLLIKYFDFSNRTNIWQQSFNHLTNNELIVGRGLGAIEAAASNHTGWVSWWNMHSEPFQILYEAGAIGLIICILAILHLFIRLIRTKPSASLAGWSGAATAFLLLSLVAFPLRFAPLLAIGCVIWAALEAHTRGEVHA